MEKCATKLLSNDAREKNGQQADKLKTSIKKNPQQKEATQKTIIIDLLEKRSLFINFSHRSLVHRTTTPRLRFFCLCCTEKRGKKIANSELQDGWKLFCRRSFATIPLSSVLLFFKYQLHSFKMFSFSFYKLC